MITSEERVRAAARFRSCCVIGGVAAPAVGLVFMLTSGGTRSVGQVLGEVIADAVLFLVLTFWSRRGVTVLAGSWGFFADYLMMAFMSLGLAALLGGLVWVVLRVGC